MIILINKNKQYDNHFMLSIIVRHEGGNCSYLLLLVSTLAIINNCLFILSIYNLDLPIFL